MGDGGAIYQKYFKFTLLLEMTAPNFDATTLYPIPKPSGTTGPNPRIFENFTKQNFEKSPPKTMVSVDRVDVERTKWFIRL